MGLCLLCCRQAAMFLCIHYNTVYVFVNKNIRKIKIFYQNIKRFHQKSESAAINYFVYCLIISASIASIDVGDNLIPLKTSCDFLGSYMRILLIVVI